MKNTYLLVFLTTIFLMPVSKVQAASASSASSTISESTSSVNTSASASGSVASTQISFATEEEPVLEEVPDELDIVANIDQNKQIETDKNQTTGEISQEVIDSQKAIDKALSELSSIQTKSSSIKTNIDKLKKSQDDRNVLAAEGLGIFAILVLIISIATRTHKNNTI
jgi:hypothetical protein